MKVGDKVVVARHGLFFDEMIDTKGKVVAIKDNRVTVRFTTLLRVDEEFVNGYLDYTYDMDRLDVVENG